MFTLSPDPGQPFRVLFVGAHSDDIEIGCGGTVLRLAREYPRLEVKWVVFSGNEARAEEARRGAALFLQGVARAEVVIHGFRDGFFPAQLEAIKEQFEALKGFEPHLVFTHARADRHQDHRVLSDLAWNTWRSQTVLEYEIPKYDGDLGQPNLYVRLEPEVLERKIDYLMQAFGTQRSKHWFDPETFRALPRLRGMESATRYAEAFYARKVVI
ncbi:PIG-L deacetylase family protein [Calidithermus roseus]|uniref:N-acetyl-alpha-D-glucosaminyl L-malate deacetylase 1 n=1 Tax=Calidithermus roseus TaxID=1644118 RepID=A0A399EPU8_9DEIN|nr:PIG-L deacetylase family protein [Calidithermus roseus]RIH84171.1 N-acetyl-alpha-D-glucosaminyl L-malate deacetylase 1 [Calidithermus roseus]